MDNVDTSMSENTSDTSTQVETQTDTGGQASDSNSADTTTQQQTEAEAFVPFKAGKEKFKVNGKEYEWDWATTQKYAQLGHAGQQAMERASKTESKARETMQWLYQAAQQDPDGLIEVLTGKRRQASAAPQAQTGHAETTPSDPREAKIQELESKLSRIEQSSEAQEVEKERVALNSEIQDSLKKYPILNDDGGVFIDVLKTQYRKALSQAVNSGVEPPSIEDTAFYLAQKIQESRQAKKQKSQERMTLNREKAPATAVPGGSGASGKPMSREEVMKLAGRI